MGLVYGALMLCSFGGTAVRLARMLAAPRFVDVILIAFLVGSAEILMSGYILSGFNAFGSAAAWAGVGVLWVAMSLLLASKRAPLTTEPKLSARFSWSELWSSIRSLSSVDKLLFLTPTAVVIGLGVLNLINALVVAPNTVDGLTYHLSRVGYYLQHGHLGYFEANYPPQAIHAKGSAVLMAWAFLAADRFEGAMLLVQYTGYWVALTAIYGMSRHLGAARRYSMLGACIFGLLTISLTQAPTPMNDLVVATYVGCALYFLVAFRRCGRPHDLLWSGVAIGMACAVKATAFVAGPALCIAAWDALDRKHCGRDAIRLVASTLLALAVFALPAGYLDNYLRFGDPFVPAPGLAQHSFAYKDFGHLLHEGSKNVLRLGLEFLSLDGLPPIDPVNRLQHIVRLPALALSPLVGLEEPGQVVAPPFAAYRDPRSHEEHAYWGMLGIGLLWIVPWVAVYGTPHGSGARRLAVAAIVYFLSVAYAGEYDPWRGRMFIAMAMFAVPAIACFLEEKQSRGWRAFTLTVVMFGCFGAVSAVVLREHGTLISASYGTRSVSSIFLQDRAGQLTSDIPRYAEPVRRFEILVPRDATVAIYGDYMFEYVFFGEGLTRRLIPLGDGRLPMRPIPAAVDFLVFSSKSLTAAAADEHLGQDWYLRKTNP